MPSGESNTAGAATDAARTSPLALALVGAVLLAPAFVRWTSFGLVSTLLGPGLDSLVGVVALGAGVHALLSDGRNPLALQAIDRAAARLTDWFDRSWGHLARTAGLLGGSVLAVFTLDGLVEFASRDLGTTDVGAGIGLAFVSMVLVLAVALVLVGLGISFQRRGGRLSVPPAQLSPLQRLLVTGGALLAVLLPLLTVSVIATGGVLAPLIPVGSSLGLLGVKLLVVGLVWILGEATWRRLNALAW